MELITAAGFTAFLQVIAIDLVLAGDNAIVIGLAAAGLPAHMRRKAILVGIIAATVLRIAFASVTVQLLNVVGLQLIGGLLLAWVCWKMWTELRSQSNNADGHATNDADLTKGNKTFFQAAVQIVQRFLVKEAKVFVIPGSEFGLGGANHMRMNVATSRQTLELALGNLARALNKSSSL